MTRKPPELPDIEDATLRACLAPLMDAMQAAVEPRASAPVGRSPPAAANSNDNPPPVEQPGFRDQPSWRMPGTLAEWRSLADDDFGAFRMMELFFAMTDLEREAAAAEYSRQIAGTIERLARIKRRLAGQYDMVTTVLALLERSMSRSTPPTSGLSRGAD